MFEALPLNELFFKSLIVLNIIFLLSLLNVRLLLLILIIVLLLYLFGFEFSFGGEVDDNKCKEEAEESEEQPVEE